jgi:hypothetical protein
MKQQLTFLLGFILCAFSEGFQSPLQPQQRTVTITKPDLSRRALLQSEDDDTDDDDHVPNKRTRLARFVARVPSYTKKILTKPLTVAVGIVLMTASSFTKPVQASAPIMAMPKQQSRDPIQEAFAAQNRRAQAQTQKELSEFGAKARQIEETQGEQARVEFEKQYKEQQIQRAAEKQEAIEQLKRNLLDQGICPFTDLEGIRQITFLQKGVDLGDVTGTQFNYEKVYQAKNYKRSDAFKLIPHRKMIASMVQDMKNRGVDPLEYFEAHQENTDAILKLPRARAEVLAAQYEANLEEYGQVSPPQPGEMSAKEQMAKRSSSPEAKKRAKEEAKLKAKQAKEEKNRQQQKTKEAAKTAAAAAVSAAKRSAETAAGAAVSLSESMIDSIEAPAEATGLDYGYQRSGVAAKLQTKTSSLSSKIRNMPIVPAGAAVIVAGGGAYAFKLYQAKQLRDEEERQRQFRLLMGEVNNVKPKTKKSSAPALEEITPDDDDDDMDAFSEPAAAPVAPVAPPPIKKRGLGLKSVFGKKKNDREVDINVLVSRDADAPEFALLLSKLLTFGAPGRFPSIQALPGAMPLQSFELNAANQLLIEARTAGNIDKVMSAEIFANVVNCMLIEIVDLASAALKEKDDKTKIDAIDIVVDFMQHAASLYDSVADGVVIAPVTYGGDLGKSKLEQMFSSYAGSTITNANGIKDGFDSRVAMLQDVFQINDKKAEGLMLKAMQKKIMEMMKSGEGMEELGELMKGMGGMDGLAGQMPGMGEGGQPDPAQVKEMLLALKRMKDSGEFSKEDLEPIKKEFKNAFGASIEDITREEPLDENEKELLDLMKSILAD